MNWPAAYGLLAHGLIFGALASLLPVGRLRPRAALAATATALLAGIAPAMHALFGMPSVTLLGLALWRLLGRENSPLGLRQAAILLAGAMIFALVQTLTDHDPYALGYQPTLLLASFLPLGLLLGWCGRQDWILLTSAGLAAYAIGLFDNLWDGLFDPLLALLAACLLLKQLISHLIAARHR